MIPIGAPVTVTWITNIKKSHGTIIEAYGKMGYYVRCDGDNYCFAESEVKIRYDKPAPFTLWQLNAILYCDANQPWYSNAHPSHPNLYETAKDIEESLDPNITSRMFLVN